MTEKKRTGLVQIFTGNGKGKTTAALGTILRAVGHSLKVYITFFMKGDYPYGERQTLAQLPNVDVTSFGSLEFCNPKKPKPEEIEQARMALEAASKALHSGKYDLVVLDEIDVALAFKLIEFDDVLGLIEDKPPEVELILTGRYADSRLIEAADLVTEMVKIKHPFDRGLKARKGIEY
ncbi:cob(I)yrinic acid a,c-diamide adenosyltransferase [Chloroflexota bacterium]